MRFHFEFNSAALFPPRSGFVQQAIRGGPSQVGFAHSLEQAIRGGPSQVGFAHSLGPSIAAFGGKYESAVKKAHILTEIARTAAANDGVPLGEARFESETGIRRADWFGKLWAKWGDAVQEAGYTPNELNPAFDDELLLGKYSEYARELGRIPTAGELRLKRRNDPQFPSWNTFARFGSKAEMVKRVMEFCRSNPGFENVIERCEKYLGSLTSVPNENESSAEKVVIGYVYIIKHGARREYKIGRTNNRLRREGEIGLELPEKIEPIHVIETDDPAGVEAYWHRRFAEKRMKGEWFALTSDDVRAFKCWRRIS